MKAASRTVVQIKPEKRKEVDDFMKEKAEDIAHEVLAKVDMLDKMDVLPAPAEVATKNSPNVPMGLSAKASST